MLCYSSGAAGMTALGFLLVHSVRLVQGLSYRDSNQQDAARGFNRVSKSRGAADQRAARVNARTTEFLRKGLGALAESGRADTTPVPDAPRLTGSNEVTQRPTAPPAPTIRPRVTTPVDALLSMAFTVVEDLIRGIILSAGAVKLFSLLYELACQVALRHGYQLTPDTVTFHSPQLVVAGLVNYTPRHVRRLVRELVAAKLVATGAHASKVGLRVLWDGTLWSVKVKAGLAEPEVRQEDWKHNWRPNFEADVHSKSGAAKFMSQLLIDEVEHSEKIRVAAKAAVDGVYNTQNPATLSSEDMISKGVEHVAYLLGELPKIHRTKRSKLVGEMATALAELMDGGMTWRRLWCKRIWRAWTEYTEGIKGALQALEAQLMRLHVDCREWTGMRSPGAVFAARTRIH